MCNITEEPNVHEIPFPILSFRMPSMSFRLKGEAFLYGLYS